MQLATIDFETYYDSEYNLDKLTTEEYVRDSRFEVIGVGITSDTGSRYWLEESQWRMVAEQTDWSQYVLLAQHAHFDGLILSHHYRVRPGYWIDTLSMGRSLHQTDIRLDLDSLSRYYGFEGKLRTVDNMRGKHRRDMTLAEWNEYGVYCLNDCDQASKVAGEMLRKMPRAELDLIDMTIRMFTESVFVLDEPLLADFVVRDAARKADLFTRLGLDKKQFSSSDKFAALLRERAIEPPLKQSPTGRNEDGSPKMIYAFAKTDPGMQILLEDENDEIRWLAEARVESKSTQAYTRAQRFLRMGQAGQVLPVYLKYAGAHTLRWAGGDGTNWQNFKRVSKKNPDAGIMKRSIRAPKGYVVVRADSAQIEARKLAWLARQLDLLEAFRNNADVYSQFASEVYGRPVNRKLVLPDGSEPDFIPGFVGKTCILGLGYGMGYYKLAIEFLKGALGGPPLVFTREDLRKLDVDPAPFMNNPRKVEQVQQMPSRLALDDRLVHSIVCEYVVNKYRGKNRAIIEYWNFLETMIEWMAEGKTGPIGYLGVLSLVPGGIRLPSGMVMHYPGLRKSESGWSYQIAPGRRSKLYGGKLCENIDQALSRIVIAEQMLEAKKYGVWTRLMGHDEIVTVVPANDGPAWTQQLIQIMKRPPQWCKDLPLSAEGGFAEAYGDAK